MGDETPLEKANAAARKSEHLRDAILSAICLAVMAGIVAAVWWLIAG